MWFLHYSQVVTNRVLGPVEVTKYPIKNTGICVKEGVPMSVAKYETEFLYLCWSQHLSQGPLLPQKKNKTKQNKQKKMLK